MVNFYWQDDKSNAGSPQVWECFWQLSFSGDGHENKIQIWKLEIQIFLWSL